MKVTIMVSLGSRTISVQEDSWERAKEVLDERLASVSGMLASEQNILDELRSKV